MKILASVLMLLMVAGPAFALDVDGKWSGSVASPQGEYPVNFTFKADGAKLTGTTMGLDGMEVQIKDGAIDGNTIAFTVAYDLGGMPFTVSYKGVLDAEQLKMSADAFGMPFEFVLKKAK